MNLVYCRSCGKQINDGAAFCGYCGQAQEKPEASSVATMTDNSNENQAISQPSSEYAENPVTTSSNASIETQPAPEAEAAKPESGPAELAEKAKISIKALLTKGSKLWKIILPAAAVIIVAFILGFNTLKLTFMPELYLAGSIENTGKIIEKRVSESNYSVFGTLFDAMKDGTVLVGFELPEDAGDAAGSTISLSMNTNVKNKDFSLAGKWDLDGDIYDISLYLDEKRVAVASDAFLKGTAYGVELEDFGRKFKKTELYDELPSYAADQIIDLFENLYDIMNIEPDKKDSNSASGIIREFMRSVEFESNRNISEKVNGKKIKCNEMVYKFDQDDLITLISDLSELYLESSIMNDIMNIADYTDSDLSYYYREFADSGLEELEDYLTGDFELRFYTNGKEQLIKIVFDGTVEFEWEGEVRIVCTMDFGADPAKSSEYIFSITAETEYGDPSEIEVVWDLSKDGNELSDIIEVMANDGYWEETISIQAVRDRKSGEFEFLMEADGYQALEIKGSLKTGSNSFELLIDSIEADDGYFYVDDINLTISAKKGAKFSNVKYVDLLSMDMDDLEDLAESIEDAFYDSDLYEFLYY